MDTPLWLFQRDEIDVFEAELEALWDHHVRRGQGSVEEMQILQEYAEAEDRAETDVLLRAGLPTSTEPCVHEAERHQQFEHMSVEEFLRHGCQRDPLYARCYAWSRRVVAWANAQIAPRRPTASDVFRAHVNALVVPVKIAFAQSSEMHEGRTARAMAVSDYTLALCYLTRASESLCRVQAVELNNEALVLIELIEKQKNGLTESQRP